VWRWRAHDFMRNSAPYWEGWFAGTTARFLACAAPRMLVLADVDRMDSLGMPLTVAQMQGKFRLQVIAGAGHVVHEDAPDKVAEAIASFLSRNGLTEAREHELLAARLAALSARAARGSPGKPEQAGSVVVAAAPAAADASNSGHVAPSPGGGGAAH
jgi:hypothetical protein